MWCICPQCVALQANTPQNLIFSIGRGAKYALIRHQGYQKKNTPTCGGKKVGGIGLEPTTSSV